MATGDFKTNGIVIAELTGLGEQLRRINEARDFYTDGEVRTAYSAAIRAIAARVRKEAPRSEYPYVAGVWRKKRDRYWTETSKPGLLRSSIVGNIFSIGTWRRWGPGAYSQVTLRRGPKPFAPHAHLVTRGRKGSVKKGFFSFFNQAGRMVFTHAVKAIPPDNFWERGVRGSEQTAIRRTVTSLERAWNKRVRG